MMIRTTRAFCFATVFAAMAFTGTAIAADLHFTPFTGSDQALSADPSAYWDGFYAGAHLGYAKGNSSNEWWNSATPATPDGDIAYEGVIGGVHAGYQAQSGGLVLGLEADLDATRLVGDDAQFEGRINEIEISALATVRGRVGWATDRLHIYATAGLAAARFEKRDVDASLYSPQLATGWVAGAGVEYAVSDALTARAEFVHVRLDRVDTAIELDGGAYGHGAIDSNLNIARVGLSYNF